MFRKKKFIDEYNKASNSIATPLDNTFLFRFEELEEIQKALQQNDFVILTGAAGNGKTKLALESISKFLDLNHNYKAYCISNKHHTLLTDLQLYFDDENDYILFVDDANRIDEFNQIVGFYKEKKGSFKIIVTVRDYAINEIENLCLDYAPKIIRVSKLTDDEIIDIIKVKPFEILKQDYHREIVRISDGNPRLAIMCSLLAKKSQNLFALHDVSELFEKYFTTFIKDNNEFANEINIKCLGLISFFYTISFKNKETTTLLLNNFGIEYSEFIDAIVKLNSLELVDIQFDHVKIPEQNLSNYFFYRAFIKDNFLSFESLLKIDFKQYKDRFRDSVIPANNTFGAKNVMNTLKPHLHKFWNEAEDSEIKFLLLSTFGYYLQNEAIGFIYEITNNLPSYSKTQNEFFDVNYNTTKLESYPIEILGELLTYQDNFNDVLELGFEYTKKLPKYLTEWINKIKSKVAIDYIDVNSNLFRQRDLFNLLMKKINDCDTFYVFVFYELSKYFLSFKFHITNGYKKNTFIWYNFPVPFTQSICDFRKNIWFAIDKNFQNNYVESIDLLKNYLKNDFEVVKEIIEYDFTFLLIIIQNHFNNSLFEHCKIVQTLVNWWETNSVSSDAIPKLRSEFTNSKYELNLILDWNWLIDKNRLKLNSYEKYNDVKEKEIRSSLVFRNNVEVEYFYNDFHYLTKDKEKVIDYHKSLDLIIDENLSNDFDICYLLLSKIIENNNELNYKPYIAFRNNLKSAEKTKKIWLLLQSYEFIHKGLWELSFFEVIDESMITNVEVQNLIKTIRNFKKDSSIYFGRFERFLSIEPKLFQIIIEIVSEKYENENVKLQVEPDSVNKYFQHLGNNISLLKTFYLQQDKLCNNFDLQGKGLVNILFIDTNFLIEYINYVLKNNNPNYALKNKDLSIVWNVVNIKNTIIEVFDLIFESENKFIYSENFYACFFTNLNSESKILAKEFILEYCNLHYLDIVKMNTIIYIVKDFMVDCFEEILVLFLTLCQDEKVFSQISWRRNSTITSGNEIHSDIEKADWEMILKMVNKLDLGIKLIPIKKYLNKQIEYCKRNSCLERQMLFLRDYF